MEQFAVIHGFQVFLIIWLISESTPCQLQNLNKLASFLQSNVSCRDLNFDKERLICKVDNPEDWISMMSFTMSSTTGSTMSSRHQSCELPKGFGACPDGSYNMTCLPLEGESGVYYRCGCHAVLEEGATSAGEWTEWNLGSGEGHQRKRKFYEGDVFTCITEMRSK